MSLLVGLRVFSPLAATGPMPRFDRFASMDNGSAALRASGSGLVTMRMSPVRRRDMLWARGALLLDTLAEDAFAPAARRSRVCSARPSAFDPWGLLARS